MYCYSYSSTLDDVDAWGKEAEKYYNGEIDRDTYDRWRYSYPDYDENSVWVKIRPSKELSDALLNGHKF